MPPSGFGFVPRSPTAYARGLIHAALRADAGAELHMDQTGPAKQCSRGENAQEFVGRGFTDVPLL